MAETKTTDKWNRASLFFTCVRVSRQEDCVFIQNYSLLSERELFQIQTSPPKVFSEDWPIYLELCEIFGSFLRLLLAVEMQILGWAVGVAP